MSSSTKPLELVSGARTPRVLSPRHAGALRLLLVAGYLLLAHFADARHDGLLAALAMGALIAVVMLRALLSRRAWAWATLVACTLVLVAMAQSRFALLPLLLVPVLLIGLAAYGFGHTLFNGRVPLITRMVAGLEAVPASELEPELRRYARRLTAAWAVLLVVLATLSLVLACLAPQGLLADFSIESPVVPPTAIRLAGVFNLTVMCGFFLVEFAYRKRRFPGRYHSLLDFLQRMGRLGPDFWRNVMH
jgi:uncharacterized membrane protein